MAAFDNLKARQAVNYAIDRNAAVKIFGGPKLATPSCQVLEHIHLGEHATNCAFDGPTLYVTATKVAEIHADRGQGRCRRLRRTRAGPAARRRRIRVAQRPYRKPKTPPCVPA
jgi:hypothetical protein